MIVRRPGGPGSPSVGLLNALFIMAFVYGLLACLVGVLTGRVWVVLMGAVATVIGGGFALTRWVDGPTHRREQ